MPVVDHGLQQYETSIEAHDANERFEMQSQLPANSDTDDQPDTLIKGSNFDTPEQEVCVEDSDVVESEIQVFNDVDDSETPIFVPTDTDTESNSNQVATSENGHEKVQIVTTNAATEASIQECKSKSSLFDAIIQPLTVGLYIFHLVFRVSDRGINFILALLRTIIKSMGQFLRNDFLMLLSSQIPQNIYQLTKILGTKKQDFHLYAVCPKCSMCYPLTTKYTTVFKCSAKVGHRVCNAEVYRKIKCKGTYKFAPKKVYVYLFSRKEIITALEEWRHRNVTENEMSDIYDGCVWKELSTPGKYLSKPNNLCLKLNVDWFKLYKHTNYSVGILYLVVENLPRNIRFNIENTIIMGCIPGPNEPKKNINSFIKPLVDELLELWHGVQIKSGSLFGVTSVRCMLTSVSADIPATRKLCGFFSHSAKRGCSKCLKVFEYENFGSKADYSGCDRSLCAPRNTADHVDILNQISRLSTATEKEELHKNWGSDILSYFGCLILT